MIKELYYGIVKYINSNLYVMGVLQVIIMYIIKIKHRGDKEETHYPIYKEKEAI